MNSYVLIVDDDPDAREILDDVIQGLGLETKQASDGLEAMEYIISDLPQLILLDLMMPGMDGFEVLFRLQARRDTRYLPVLVITACGPEQTHMLSLPGISGVLRKGHYSISHLGDTIKKMLGMSDAKHIVH